jgi:hypothetical protein
MVQKAVIEMGGINYRSNLKKNLFIFILLMFNLGELLESMFKTIFFYLGHCCSETCLKKGPFGTIFGQ